MKLLKPSDEYPCSVCGLGAVELETLYGLEVLAHTCEQGHRTVLSDDPRYNPEQQSVEKIEQGN